MGGKDIVAECSQALRSSSFEYEQLLGASVERVWLGVARAVERSLLAKRGLCVPGLGKFGFHKETPHALVFFLSDRFLQSHRGVLWRNKPPPAPLAVSSDLNMAVVGGELGLARDQVQQSLDELLRFVGRKLVSASANGHLTIGSVGSFAFEGRALSFRFDAGFAKRMSELQGCQDPSVAEGGLSSGRRDQTRKRDGGSLRSSKQALQRSASVDGLLGEAVDAFVRHQVESVSLSGDGGAHTRSAMQIGLRSECDEAGHSRCGHASKQSTKKRHHHKYYRGRSPERARSPSEDNDTLNSGTTDPVPRILPRFLIPEPSIPVKPRHSQVNHDLAMQAAFEREKTRLAGVRQDNDRYQHEFESRQRATQLATLQQRAEKVVGQRSLNAFLNYQIGDKHERLRRQNKQIEDAIDPSSVTILPRDCSLSADAKREQKQTLNKRLNDQVAAKAALKRNRRVVDQAEMAYFVAQLDAQALEETEAKLAHTRESKQALLSDWSRQLQLRAIQKELQNSR